jgi:hypothetical protein
MIKTHRIEAHARTLRTNVVRSAIATQRRGEKSVNKQAAL